MLPLFCQNDYNGKNEGFWKELQHKNKTQNNDPAVNLMSFRTCTVYYWFTAISELYVFVCHVIPQQFADYSDTAQFYLKVLVWYVFFQITANWACVIRYNSSYCSGTNRTSPTKGHQNARHVDLDSFRNGSVQRTIVGRVRNTDIDAVAEQSDSVRIDVENSLGLDNGSMAGKKDDLYDALKWRWCDMCNDQSPPRSHHCKVCNRCILKRDHHCFMTGVCIGHYNQRYFVVLATYVALASIMGLYLISRHLRDTLPDSSYANYFLPVTFYRMVVSGTIMLHQYLMVCLMYTLSWSSLVSTAYSTWQMSIITAGKTSYEINKKIPVECASTVIENFQSVFGPFWILSFLFPAQFISPQSDDGTRWNMKPEEKRNDNIYSTTRKTYSIIKEV